MQGSCLYCFICVISLIFTVFSSLPRNLWKMLSRTSFQTVRPLRQGSSKYHTNPVETLTCCIRDKIKRLKKKKKMFGRWTSFTWWKCSDSIIRMCIPLFFSVTRRRPIKGAAQRPVQYSYPDSPVSPMTQQRREVERYLVPIHIQILVFIIVACVLYLIYVNVEDSLSYW